MKKCFLVALVLCQLKLYAQDSSLSFKVVALKDNKAQISWLNPFSNCVQLSIQKSYDSLRFFQTIFSSLSPELPQNGFTDNNYLPQVKTFYRVFYVLEDGSYFFTKSQRPQKMTGQTDFKNGLPKTDAKRIIDASTTNTIFDSAVYKKLLQAIQTSPAAVQEKKLISIYKNNLDNFYNIVTVDIYSKFKDSIAQKTKDTILSFTDDIVIWKPFVPKPSWKPSKYLYTPDAGYLVIDLPDAKQHKYKVIVYDDTDREIFKIKHIKQHKLILEKYNFMHEGWYWFELYEDDKLKEKNSFFIEKDF